MWRHGSKGWVHFSSLSNQGNGAVRDRRQWAWPLVCRGDGDELDINHEVSERKHSSFCCCLSRSADFPCPPFHLHLSSFCGYPSPSQLTTYPLSSLSHAQWHLDLFIVLFPALPWQFGCHLKCYRSLQLSPVWSVLTFHRGQELVLASFSIIISKKRKAL